MSVLSHLLHLATRFVWSLDPRPPTEADRAWVRNHLTEGELAVWEAMSNPDQRHSIDVARAVDAVVVHNDAGAIGGWKAADEQGFESASHRQSVMIAAALLHDSGKNASGLGTPARVAATAIRPLLDREVVSRWSRSEGVRRRLVDYWRHPEIGGQVLADAGSHPLVSTWAVEHHRPERSWTVEPSLGQILRHCDND
mgnify:CR=1 FL=1